jgi:hypothetical protein
MLLTIIFPAIAAVGVIATVALNVLTLRIGRLNHEKIQQLNVNVDGKLAALIESISKERYSAGKEQERIEARARSAGAIAEVADAAATVAEAAKVAAASVIATAVEVAKGA